LEVAALTQFLWDNILLVGLMFASGIMLVWPGISGLLSGARQIGTLEATRLMNKGNAIVLDVSELGEFAAGRIPKSKNVPLAELARRLDEISKFKDKPVIVTCASGPRAGGALRILKGAGFSDTYSLKGGLSAWREASLPVEK
jgi:rhodanese-related sulfurtransferase